MYCPECEEETMVVQTRQRADGTIYRRRECLWCGHRFSTTESLMAPKEAAEDENRELPLLQCAPKRKKVRPWGMSDLCIALRSRPEVVIDAGHAAAQEAGQVAG